MQIVVEEYLASTVSNGLVTLGLSCIAGILDAGLIPMSSSAELLHLVQSFDNMHTGLQMIAQTGK